jgi:diguanylate cyclase (GGDEF)-like protein
VLLLSLSVIVVLDRTMLRPLRRLAERADELDSGQSPLDLLATVPAGQSSEVSRVARSLMRAHHGVWLRWQDELQQVQQLQQQVQSQAAQLQAAALSLEQKNRELGSLSRSDALTGLANRREFDEALRREFKRAQRQRGQLALAVLDLDHFKRYNEQHGAAVGDQALQRFAQLLSERFKRDTDFVARLGGEEFVALLPGFGLDVTQELMEQLREELRALRLPHGGSEDEGTGLTVSIGLAAYSPAHPYLSPQSLMQAADEALYIAKHAGRDRLSLASSKSLTERA